MFTQHLLSSSAHHWFDRGILTAPPRRTAAVPGVCVWVQDGLAPQVFRAAQTAGISLTWRSFSPVTSLTLGLGAGGRGVERTVHRRVHGARA
jgi:hypothetical protein